ncbi:hypothetical protein FA95DRAFT_330312 [Auriscalpium vulgare]|uniref:Uncharacterized protein n=1 Tax=Auriscalpium vulgare TaxID=40419 RepID=A0ACB8RIC4_9AGAM|nr:hypothetical protein FA95DRAFT_330312 [Auriscalpium vulgare]
MASAYIQPSEMSQTTPPVARLPPEILCHIFSYLSTRPPPHHDSWMWQTVTHVCMSWRAIAIASPLLWTHVDFRSYEWTREFLRRSQSAPLYVHTQDHLLQPGGDLASIHWALEEMPRIRELHLVGHPDTLEAVEEHLLQAAPQLETLTISVTPRGKGHDPAYVLSRDVFDGHAPRLRRLSLRMCCIEPSMPILPGLTHLSMDVPDARGSYHMGTLLEILSQPTRLEAVVIKGAVTDGETRICDTDHGAVSLPRLSSLRLSGSTAACTHLLAHLSIPRSAVRRSSYRILLADNKDDNASDGLDLLDSVERETSDGMGSESIWTVT